MKKVIKKWTLVVLTLVLVLGVAPLFGLQAQAEEFYTDPMISAGLHHTLALKSDGTVWAWGANYYGQLGDGTTSGTPGRPIPARVDNLDEVTAISAGGAYSLALKSDGTVWAWGSNRHGELGDGTQTNSTIPVQVKNLIGVTAIVAGEDRSLALKSDGTVWAWGNNFLGLLLGDDVLPGSIKNPTQVQNLVEITAIATTVDLGAAHSLAIKSDGTVWAWGSNSGGQLGDGTTISRTTAAQVNNLDKIIAVAAERGYSLALKSDGTVWTSRSNGGGQINNLTGVTAVSAGGSHYAVAVKTDGTVWAWGDSSSGQLGDGRFGKRTEPVQAKGEGGVGYLNLYVGNTRPTSPAISTESLTDKLRSTQKEVALIVVLGIALLGGIIVFVVIQGKKKNR